MNKCDKCNKSFTKDNSPDGVNGYGIQEIIKEAPNQTKALELCKDCYVKAYKEKCDCEPTI